MHATKPKNLNKKTADTVKIQDDAIEQHLNLKKRMQLEKHYGKNCPSEKNSKHNSHNSSAFATCINFLTSDERFSTLSLTTKMLKHVKFDLNLDCVGTVHVSNSCSNFRSLEHIPADITVVDKLK